MSDYDEPRSNAGAADFVKDPDAVLDYAFDWSIPLDGDQITGSQFLLPDGLTQVSSSFEDTRTKVFLAGGDAEVIYRVTNRIQTAGGRVFDRTIRIVVREQ